MTNTLCIYHAECLDGAAAAAVVKYKFPRAKLVAAKHGDAAPSSLGGSQVFIVDFSFPAKILNGIRQDSKEVLWYDHHKTALPIQKEVGFGLIDLKESGATLTWKQLFPEKKLPKILEYVRDKDLWQWKLPHSREINANLGETENILNPASPFWKHLLKGPSPQEWKKMVEQGHYSRMTLRQRLEKAIRRGFLVDLDGLRAFAVNWSDDSSNLGEMIYKELKHPVALIFSYNGKEWTFSLRSNQVDVSEIALRYGGGGHRGAAGFRSDTIEWLFEKRIHNTP